MNRLTIVSGIIILVCSTLSAADFAQYEKAAAVFQERDEVYLALYPRSIEEVRPLTCYLSIDRVDPGSTALTAYASKSAFETFIKTGIPYEVLTPPCFQAKVTMSDFKEYLSRKIPPVGAAKTTAPLAAAGNWYVYPTYDAFLAIMTKFQSDYPSIVQLVELGKSVQGRKILALKVTKNVASVSSGRPKFLLISTIHGDEVLNYMSTLHMLDTMLSTYGTDMRFTRLIDNIEMWFIPLANPDAAYKGGNSTVQSAQRYNMNGVDVNRNYPCPCGVTGNHAVYGLYTRREPENTALFGLMERNSFNLTTDLHSGTETALWPYAATSRLACDLDWYKWASKRFVDQVHVDCNNNGYFTRNQTGMVNVYSGLYEAHGTSIDYTLIKRHGKMLAFETSENKILPQSDLEKYWRYGRESFIRFYELLLTGIQGTVRNSSTKAPLYSVKITEAAHDFDSAFVYTDSSGFYVRFIQKGTWNLTFSKEGYVSKTVAITVADYGVKYPLDVELEPVGVAVSGAVKTIDRGNTRRAMPVAGGISLYCGDLAEGTAIAIYDLRGNLLRQFTVTQAPRIIWDKKDREGHSTGDGCRIFRATGSGGTVSYSFIAEH